MPDALIWPAVAIICAIVLGIAALFLLRPALMRLIDRISKAGKDGVSFEGSQERGEVKPPALSFPELMKEPIYASILAREDYLKEQIHLLNLQNSEEKMSVLTRIAARSRVEMEFNNLSNIIYGSQVAVLVQLSSTHTSIPLSKFESIYDQAKDKFQAMYEKRSFEEWFRFLTNNNLVVQRETNIEITQYGSDFLKYLVDARLAYERIG
jgi:hypothetical protein